MTSYVTVNGADLSSYDYHPSHECGRNQLLFLIIIFVLALLGWIVYLSVELFALKKEIDG